MNNKFIKKALVLVLSLMIQTTFSNIAYSADTSSRVTADTNITDRYSLPPNKAYIEPCQREALRLHPGIIEKQRLLHRDGDFLMRYEIQALDGQVWFMQCNLTNGKIIDVF